MSVYFVVSHFLAPHIFILCITYTHKKKLFFGVYVYILYIIYYILYIIYYIADERGGLCFFNAAVVVLYLRSSVCSLNSFSDSISSQIFFFTLSK